MQLSNFERARKYAGCVEGAVSGQNGHGHTFRLACRLAIGFDLNESETLQILEEWNPTCSPSWSSKELSHKVRQAMKEKEKDPEAIGILLRKNKPGYEERPETSQFRPANQIPEEKSENRTLRTEIGKVSVRNKTVSQGNNGPIGQRQPIPSFIKNPSLDFIHTINSKIVSEVSEIDEKAFHVEQCTIKKADSAENDIKTDDPELQKILKKADWVLEDAMKLGKAGLLPVEEFDLDRYDFLRPRLENTNFRCKRIKAVGYTLESGWHVYIDWKPDTLGDWILDGDQFRKLKKEEKQ